MREHGSRRDRTIEEFFAVLSLQSDTPFFKCQMRFITQENTDASRLMHRSLASKSFQAKRSLVLARSSKRT